MKNFIVFVLGKVAVCQKASGLFGIFFSKQPLCQESSIWGYVIVERLVDGLDKLGLEGGIVLWLLFNHYSNLEFKFNHANQTCLI